jgi:hypothetical protein
MVGVNMVYNEILDKYTRHRLNDSLSLQYGRLSTISKSVGCRSEEVFGRAANGHRFQPFVLHVEDAWVDVLRKSVYSTRNHEWVAHPLVSWDADQRTEKGHFDVNPSIDTESSVILEGRCLYLDSVWATSFFHFMSETLGKCYVASRFLSLDSFDHIILTGTKFPYILQWFRMLGVEDKVYSPPAQKTGLLMDSLYVPSYSQHCGWFSKELVCYIDSFIQLNSMDATGRPRKGFYISRGGSRKIINESQVTEYLEARNFQLIRLEELSVSDQAFAFRDCGLVVAPHGAGLTNILYSSPGVRVFELFGSDYINKCFYSLSDLLGHEHYYHVSNMIDGKGNFSISMDVFEEFFGILETRATS